MLQTTALSAGLHEEISLPPRGGWKCIRIGGGEEADIFLYQEGPFAGKVGRRPSLEGEHRKPLNEKNMLELFHCHQLAYQLFPAYNLNVLALDLNNYEMFSEKVERSIENIRHATAHGISLRHTEAEKGPYPPAAERADNKMRAAGIFVHNGLPNISVIGERVTFFEVIDVRTAKAEAYLRSLRLPRPVEEKLLTLTAAIAFEQTLNVQLFDDLLDDRNARLRLLKEHGRSALEAFYDRQIGPQGPIIPWCRARHFA